MSLELPPDLRSFVETELASGRFRSESDVIREGLLLLKERQRKLDALRADLQPGLERLDRGEGIEITAEELKAGARERLRKAD